MKEVYKIKHIPTGLFIQPSNSGNNWSTIGKKGKIYEGPNMWTKVQNGTEYRIVESNQGSNTYKSLAEKFPDKITKSICHYGIGCVKFITKPEDFEKVIVNKSHEGILEMNCASDPKWVKPYQEYLINELHLSRTDAIFAIGTLETLMRKYNGNN